MRSRVHAAAGAAAFGLLAWILKPLLPLLTMVSGSVAALATLRQGAMEGLAVIALAAGVMALATTAILGTPVPALAVAVAIWLPVWLCAVVLRYSGNQGLLLLTVGLLAGLFAGGMRLVKGDVQAWWRGLLEQTLQAMSARGGAPQVSPGDLDSAAALMNSMVAGSMATTLVMTLLIARWWQALLYNPGGFGREFRALRIPRLPMLLAILGVMATVAMPVLTSAPKWQPGFGVDLLVIGAAISAFQGLALVHHQVQVRGMGRTWLVLLYAVLLIQLQYAGVVLAVTGLADVMLDFRSRQRPPSSLA